MYKFLLLVFMSDSSRGRDEIEEFDNTLLKEVQVLTNDNIAAARDYEVL